MVALQLGRTAAVIVLLAACGGQNEPDCQGECDSVIGAGGAGAGSGGSGGTLSKPIPPPAGPFPSATGAAEACAQPGKTDGPDDGESVRAWLVRRWYFCSGSYIFLEAHAGLEIASDGTWYFLDLVGGELVRREGFNGGGNWSFYENPSSEPNAYTVQVNLDRYSGGGLGGFVRFAVSPLKVNLSMGGAGPSEYVAVEP